MSQPRQHRPFRPPFHSTLQLDCHPQSYTEPSTHCTLCSSFPSPHSQRSLPVPDFDAHQDPTRPDVHPSYRLAFFSKAVIISLHMTHRHNQHPTSWFPATSLLYPDYLCSSPPSFIMSQTTTINPNPVVCVPVSPSHFREAYCLADSDDDSVGKQSHRGKHTPEHTQTRQVVQKNALPSPTPLPMALGLRRAVRRGPKRCEYQPADQTVQPQTT